MKKWTEIPFKHKVLFAAVATGILVSTCSTYDSKVPVDASCDSSCALPNVPPPKVEEQSLSQENWSFKLTGSGWVDTDIATPEAKVAKINDSTKMVVIFVKKEIGDITYPECVVSTIRAFIDDGDRIDSITQVTLSGQKAILAQFDKDGKVIWSWITVADGFGYSLTCGGEIDVDAGSGQHDFCQTVADSLQIK
jgi:hypothetical protein